MFNFSPCHLFFWETIVVTDQAGVFSSSLTHSLEKESRHGLETWCAVSTICLLETFSASPSLKKAKVDEWTQCSHCWSVALCLNVRLVAGNKSALEDISKATLQESCYHHHPQSRLTSIFQVLKWQAATKNMDRLHGYASVLFFSQNLLPPTPKINIMYFLFLPSHFFFFIEFKMVPMLMSDSI